MTEVLTVIGTRPEIIRVSRLVPLLDRHFDHKFVFTSQHYSKNMCDIFFKELGVRKPDVFLDLRSSDMRQLSASIYKNVKHTNPENVLVYGDTNSTLAGARAARKAKTKLIHVEAGFRSFDSRMPEERNRVQADRLSDILFAPTPLTKKFLHKEGIVKNVFVVGDVTLDALRRFTPNAEKSNVIKRLGLKKEDYVLFTAHRQENVDNPRRLVSIVKSLEEAGGDIVYPVHPRTRKMLKKFGLKLPKNVIETQPLGYFDFLKLEKNSSLVITDSGGVQGEAFAFRVPCITIRETTERWETVALGANFLAGVEPLMVRYYRTMITESGLRKKLGSILNPYGDGRSSERIVKDIRNLS